MNSRKVIIFMVVTVVVLFAALDAKSVAGLRAPQDQLGIGLPVDVKRDHKLQPMGLLSTMYEVEVILPKEYYNRENLEGLFRHYSEKYSNSAERIMLTVYTSVENYENRKTQARGKGVFNGPSISPEPPSEKENVNGGPRRGVLYDAVFYRESPRPSSNDSPDEFYIYCPDLNKPNESERVVMKGKDPFKPNLNG